MFLPQNLRLHRLYLTRWIRVFACIKVFTVSVEVVVDVVDLICKCWPFRVGTSRLHCVDHWMGRCNLQLQILPQIIQLAASIFSSWDLGVFHIVLFHYDVGLFSSFRFKSLGTLQMSILCSL